MLQKNKRKILITIAMTVIVSSSCSRLSYLVIEKDNTAEIQKQEQKQELQKRRQEILSSNKDRVEINGIIWATSNVGANNPEDSGNYYTWDEAQNACPSGWRLPTRDEFVSLINTDSKWIIDGRHKKSTFNPSLRA